jgi:ribosomal protein L16 Arg81 hydroxylase
LPFRRSGIPRSARASLHFWIGDDQAKEVTIRAGEVLHIPSMVWHKAEALEDTLDVDVFSPPRADWLAKSRIVVLAQLGLKSNSAIGTAPLIVDLAKTAADRQALR